MCGGALLPLRGEEDKVIASKKIFTCFPLYGVRRAFPICTTPSTPVAQTLCANARLCKLQTSLERNEARTVLKPHVFGCRFSCDRILPSLRLEVERFQNPWKKPSSWSLVLRDLDSAYVKEQKELHVLLVLLFWTWCAWFAPFLQRIVVHDDFSFPRTIHAGSCRHVVAASLLIIYCGCILLVHYHVHCYSFACCCAFLPCSSLQSFLNETFHRGTLIANFQPPTLRCLLVPSRH